MKTFLSSIVTGIVGLAFALCGEMASAQSTNLYWAGSNSIPYQTGIPATRIAGPGVYPLIGGGATNNVSISGIAMPTNSLNTVLIGGTANVWGNPGTITNLIQNVSQFDDLGFTWQHTCLPSATNNGVGVEVFASYDNGLIFSSTPCIVATNVVTAAQEAAAGGAYVYTFTTNNFAPGATTLAIETFNLTTNWGTTGGWNVTNVSCEIGLKAPMQTIIQQGYGTGNGTW
jgi:hypothetical protein